MSHKREPARLRYPDTGCTAWVAGRCRLDPVTADSALVALDTYDCSEGVNDGVLARLVREAVDLDELAALRLVRAALEYYAVLLEAGLVSQTDGDGGAE